MSPLSDFWARNSSDLSIPNWQASNQQYVRLLCEGKESERIFVVEDGKQVIGFIYYLLKLDSQSGEIGINAVHPNHQGKGIGVMMYHY